MTALRNLLVVAALVFVPFAVRGDGQIVFIPAATGGGGGGGGVSFPLLAPAGTVAAPSYSFTGDADTGLFSRTPGVVNLGANGTNMLEVDQFSATVNGSFSSAGATSAPGLTLTLNSPVILFQNSGLSIRVGANSPEGVVTAPIGSLYLRTNGGANTSLYVKETGAGSSGWTPK